MENSTIKPFYNTTIPIDWEVKRLGEICSTFKSGYGITSEDINEARKIKYFQLKYSTLDSEKEWTAATISPRHKGKAKGTINSFAKNFKEKIDKYGLDFVLSKYEYYFVTNRPIDINIKKLINLNKQNKSENENEEITKEITKIYQRFFEDSELTKVEFHAFLSIFDFPIILFITFSSIIKYFSFFKNILCKKPFSFIIFISIAF
jgi:hypothetical protein